MPKKLDSPIQYPTGYTLDLYCDHEHKFAGFPHQFFGETFGQCAKMARSKGWKINTRSRTATCPSCVRALAAETSNGA